MKHVAMDQNIDTVIDTADLVVYGSFLKEHSFPGVLLKAMCFEKPIVAPDLPATRKYVSIIIIIILIGKFSGVYIYYFLNFPA